MRFRLRELDGLAFVQPRGAILRLPYCRAPLPGIIYAGELPLCLIFVLSTSRLGFVYGNSVLDRRPKCLYLRRMPPRSLQLASVEETFGRNGWYCEPLDGKEVLRAVFTGHHTRVELITQAYPPLNALAVLGEMPLPISEVQQPYVLELLARANKNLNLGGFEYDLDRQRLVFRITNIFERERYDSDIVTTMVHCAVAELDRCAAFAITITRTQEDLLPDLDLELLLMRDDLIPPVPDQDEEL